MDPMTMLSSLPSFTSTSDDDPILRGDGRLLLDPKASNSQSIAQGDFILGSGQKNSPLAAVAIAAGLVLATLLLLGGD